MSRNPILFVHWGEEGIRGSERVLLDLVTALDRERYEPYLWCNAVSMAEAARAIGVEAEVSEMPILLGWSSPKIDLSSYRRLVRRGEELIRKRRIRLVHANSGAPNQWMVPAARTTRVPLIAHLHAIYKFRERCTLLLHQAPVIAGCSAAVLRPFAADGVPEDRLRVIHNGVDLTRLNRGTAVGLRKTLGMLEDSVLVVGAGALVPLKGFDLVIRAVGMAAQSGLDLHLAIAGTGPANSELRALSNELGISNRVHFLGQVDNLGATFRDAADIVVIGSHIESFGLVAAEAGAVGKPTVATAVGGIPELVTDGISGILVPPRDTKRLADALLRLANDARLRQKMGAAARDDVLARLTTDRMTRSFETLYDEMLARPASGFGWSGIRFQVAPFARLGLQVVGRRLGVTRAET